MTLEVGFGKVKITPPLGTLCAQGLGYECRQILDDVFVRAVALREGDSAVCLLSADVLGLDRRDIEEMRAAVRAATGLAADRVVCHSTHSHESPGARSGCSEALAPYGLAFHSEHFFTSLVEGAGQAAAEALNGARAAEIRYGQAEVKGLASNRRCGVVRDDDPSIPWMRSSRARPEHRALPVGDIDPLVRVLAFFDGGKPFGVMMNYACHVTVAGGDEAPYVTADFPGEALRRLAEEDGLEGIHFTGAAGDINPGKFTTSGNSIEERVADVKRLGGVYLDAVRQAIKSGEPLSPGALLWRTKPIFLPLRADFPSRRDLAARVAEAAAAYKAARAEEKASAIDPYQQDLLRAGAVRQVVGVHMATEISALRIGDFGAVFLPGECFLDIDRQIRARAGLPKFMTIAYGDLAMGYICSRQAYQEGGYGPAASALAPEATDLLIDEAVGLLRNLGT